VGHAAVFADNAALVTSQWQYRVLTVSLHPPTKSEHEAGQAESTVIPIFGMTRPGIEPILLAVVARAQPTVSISWFIKPECP